MSKPVIVEVTEPTGEKYRTVEVEIRDPAADKYRDMQAAMLLESIGAVKQKSGGYKLPTKKGGD